jgi:hypothetical protein
MDRIKEVGVYNLFGPWNVTWQIKPNIIPKVCMVHKGFLVLIMICLSEIFYNLSGESFVVQGYKEVLKDILIRLAMWLSKVYKQR